MWEKYGTAGHATDECIIRRMRIACWILEATDTHSEYVILIAFPLPQWLRHRILVLCLYRTLCSVLKAVGSQSNQWNSSTWEVPCSNVQDSYHDLDVS